MLGLGLGLVGRPRGECYILHIVQNMKGTLTMNELIAITYHSHHTCHVPVRHNMHSIHAMCQCDTTCIPYMPCAATQHAFHACHVLVRHNMHVAVADREARSQHMSERSHINRPRLFTIQIPPTLHPSTIQIPPLHQTREFRQGQQIQRWKQHQGQDRGCPRGLLPLLS